MCLLVDARSRRPAIGTASPTCSYRDRVSGITVRVSVDARRGHRTEQLAPGISADGRHVVFARRRPIWSRETERRC